jgi:transposase
MDERRKPMEQKKLTQVEREQIYVQKQTGKNLPEIAEEIGISYECAQKWWRRGRDEGLSGLLERKRGKPVQGVLSQFSAEVQKQFRFEANPQTLGSQSSANRNVQ